VVKNVSLASCGNWASPLNAPNIARSRRTVRKEYQLLPICREQDFHANRPNQKWTTDTTSIWTQEGWLYLAVVLNLFSRMVVGWSMAANQDATLVLQALHMAIARRWTASGVDFLTRIVVALIPVQTIWSWYSRMAWYRALVALPTVTTMQ